MTCPSDSAFEKFVADKLPKALEEQIAEHLETCEACRQRAEAIHGGEHLRTVKQNGGTLTLDLSNPTLSEPEDLRAGLYGMVGNGTKAIPPASEPTAELFRLLTAEPTDDVAGTKLSHFTVRRWLGAGAFGVVYLAYDELLHREVALKLPRAQPLARREVRERFLREAEAAAKLHHANVVPVFEAGQEHGICYIASAYCRGPALDAWLDKQTEPVPVRTAVAIVRQLASAMQHAHDHRVLHRDIKPSNVLLETDLADPQSLVPMITDFGLAKLLDANATDASTAGSQGMLGTPRYMAPEQASGNRALIGPTTDIFGLGAILYELLVGAAPYAGEDEARTLHRLFYDRVVPPRRLRHEVPRDLEAICLKCLEKKNEDRYHTAQELADDLRRFEQGRVTHARPISRLELLRRWTVRQPATATLLALIAAGLLTLLGLLMAYSRSLESFNDDIQAALDETRRAQNAVEVQRARLRNLLYVSKIQLAHQAVEEKDLPQASRMLIEARAEAPALAGGFVWRYLWNRVSAPGQEIDNSGADTYDLHFSPSGERVAACGADSILRIYDGRTLARRLSFSTEQGEINSVAFSPDERLVATAGDDGTIRLWDSATGEPQRTIRAHQGLAFGVLFTPDGENLVSCGRDPVIRLWDVRTGESRGTLEGHAQAVEAIVLSPEGEHLASVSSDHMGRIWNLESRESVRVLDGHEGRVVAAEYSPRGDYLLTGSIDHTIRLWRTADGECLQIESHVDPIASVAFLEGDAKLVAGDRGGSIHVWKRNPREPAADPESTTLHSWKAHEGRVWEVIATPDQSGLMTAGADGKIYRWKRLLSAHESLDVAADEEILDFAFDSDAARVHFISSAVGVQTWDIITGQRSAIVEQTDAADRQPAGLSMLPNQVLVTAFSDGTIEGRKLPSENVGFRLQVPWEPVPQWKVDHLTASRDGRRLALFSFAHDTTLVYDLTQTSLTGRYKAYSQAMALSADGSRLAMSDADDVVVWDTDRGKGIARLKGHTSSIVALQFSPDGRRLASGSKDRQIRLWDLEVKREPLMFNGHRDEITTVAFSPDGRLLASGDARGEVKFWFLPEAAELISIEGSAPIRQLRFSAAGDRLALQTDHQIRIFDATTDYFSNAGTAESKKKE